jgi:hypothetical protein
MLLAGRKLRLEFGEVMAKRIVAALGDAGLQITLADVS